MIAVMTVMTAASCGRKADDPTEDKITPTPPAVIEVTPPPAEEILANTDATGAGNSDYRLVIDAADEVHDISDTLFGIFFEDINFAADGGLYAEMVKNRSFEFTEYAANDQLHGWTAVNKAGLEVVKNDQATYLNENNPNYLVITNEKTDPAGASNPGWLDGMYVKEGEGYRFSVYARAMNGYEGPVYVDLLEGNEVLCSDKIEALTSEWQKYELRLTPSKTAYRAVRLRVMIDTGSAAFDMISLFPEDTYKGRENGLRRDLVEKLEELSPGFLRFPGGCIIEGTTLATAYDWKSSIGVGKDGLPILWNGKYGDVAVRKQGINIWTDERQTNDKYPSFMSYGLGFFEFFQLAEDIGAIGVPVVNCGLACMGQGSGNGPEVGTEGFERYVRDALDLVEFCRGDASTVWGRVRCDLGHEEPFALKYIAIGNEQFGVKFYEHYEAFVEAFAKAAEDDPEMYGDIELIYSAGLDDGDSGSSSYMQSYKRAANWLKKNPGKDISDYAGATDQHYYNAPSWFLENNDYYDENNYSRTVDNMTTARFGGAIPVFVGEYAAQSNNLKAALAEASYMTGLERNGDIVVMAAYAPLFGNTTATHWSPDLIWFNNHTCAPSANYYMQKIFAENAGTKLLRSTFTGTEREPEPLKGCVGVGTWDTAASYDNIVVTDNLTGNVLAEDDFSSGELSAAWTKATDGAWSVENGVLKQKNTYTDTNRYSTTGSVLYFGDSSWTDYTLTLDARIDGGSEGFLIPFAVRGVENNYFWNVGGWTNTVSCLQQVSDANKSGPLNGTTKRLKLTRGQTYQLKLEVSGTNVKCYIDGVLYVDYDSARTGAADCYHVVSTDESGDIIIKLVNVTGEPRTVEVEIGNSGTLNPYAVWEQVSGNDPNDTNNVGKDEKVKLVKGYCEGTSDSFVYKTAPYSVTVLRLKKIPE